ACSTPSKAPGAPGNTTHDPTGNASASPPAPTAPNTPGSTPPTPPPTGPCPPPNKPLSGTAARLFARMARGHHAAGERLAAVVRCGHGRACVHAGFGLIFGAFDFAVTDNGEWIMLECNPFGAYGWIEDALHLPITSTLADVLRTGIAHS